MPVIQYYRSPGLSPGAADVRLGQIKAICPSIQTLITEACFNVEVTSPLASAQVDKLTAILSDPLNPSSLRNTSSLSKEGGTLIEIGPRLNFSTAFSSNAVSICQSVGLKQVVRLELSLRYLITSAACLSGVARESVLALLHDRMTQCEYREPLTTFSHGIEPEQWFAVDIQSHGRKALEEVNSKLGLAFDDWDLDYYTDLFLNKLKRNPSSVECFDLAQSNSEHSRHWFFKGRMVVDGVEVDKSLIDMIIDTQNHSNDNNVIKFSDNSSAIKGFHIGKFRPEDTSSPSPFRLQDGDTHLIFTAETHNFPTGVAPFSGATTGTGGRLRDVQSVGRGGHPIAGTAGYCVGNLNIPGYNLPWEDDSLPYPGNFAAPLEIIVEASSGASDYGNKFGEPLISGFVRSFGLVLPNGRREWIKPIMFSGGLGVMDHDMVAKTAPAKDMRVVKVGGPVYRIGVGGGAASSVEVQGDNKAELDFGAVQRGDAEMEQKLNRVIRGCLEVGAKNPILSIHDQGAGGNGNVLKELVEPVGAVIFSKLFTLGDHSISPLELWGAEYQESNALLCRSQDVALIESIARREKCPIDVVGVVTGTGKIILTEEEPNLNKYLSVPADEKSKHPVDLDLELVLGKMPQKVFNLQTERVKLSPLELPPGLKVLEALNRVLRLPSVSSKRYLTNKVDRCVTGLIAQQQCVGPLHTPLADVAVTAVSHFNNEGIATAIGEQPIKGLISAAAGARLSVAESLSNLVFAAITDIRDVKCSGNWMWAAKLPGEGAALVEACNAMCEFMSRVGVAVDGGKDSLSMAARVGSETVKAPGALVISTYAPCPDIRKVVTPDFKGYMSHIYLVDLSGGKKRLGGSALAQCFRQLGNDVPDVEDPELFVRAFNATQAVIKEGLILSGHDVSDGGLITTLLEMSFGGIKGMSIDINDPTRSAIELLFAEEVGWVLEVDAEDKNTVKRVEETFRAANVPLQYVGHTGPSGIDCRIIVKVNGEHVAVKPCHELFSIWEETSYQLELRQATPACVKQEFTKLKYRKAPKYNLSFDPDVYLQHRAFTNPPRVAVIREEGTNGDREMAASLFQAGFEVYDVTMQDLLLRSLTLDRFRGAIFPGGFSYADVLGSAKGWATSFLFNKELWAQLRAFTARSDTFSLGVCNGCQLMSLLGWINAAPQKDDEAPKPDVVLAQNLSERFECRFSTVRIEESKSIMLRNMEKTVLGVWVAHGEGRFLFRNDEVHQTIKTNKCIALRYVNDSGVPTEEYPLNPNGSVEGVAGVCSPDGRHLAMMPHPERCTQMWQWPYVPRAWSHVKTSPWAAMFRNAIDWCLTVQD